MKKNPFLKSIIIFLVQMRDLQELCNYLGFFTILRRRKHYTLLKAFCGALEFSVHYSLPCNRGTDNLVLTPNIAFIWENKMR